MRSKVDLNKFCFLKKKSNLTKFFLNPSRQQRRQQQQIHGQQGPLTDHRMRVMIRNQAFRMTLSFLRLVPEAGIQRPLPKYTF
jgi:hypothetical protein